MDLEVVFVVLQFLCHWRVSLCLFASSALAILLVNVFPWLTGLQGIAIALLGLAPGAAWEAKEWTARQPQTPKSAETSAWVAGAAAVIAGAAWGALSSTSMHSFFAGAVIFLLIAKSCSWGIAEFNYGVAKERVYLSVALAGLAYPIPALVAKNAL